MRFSHGFFLAALLVPIFPIPASGYAPYVSEIFPNTADDANEEYFAIANPSCEPLALSGYSVADAS